MRFARSSPYLFPRAFSLDFPALLSYIADYLGKLPHVSQIPPQLFGNQFIHYNHLRPLIGGNETHLFPPLLSFPVSVSDLPDFTSLPSHKGE